jgi:hypothetical protein
VEGGSRVARPIWQFYINARSLLVLTNNILASMILQVSILLAMSYEEKIDLVSAFIFRNRVPGLIQERYKFEPR